MTAPPGAAAEARAVRKQLKAMKREEGADPAQLQALKARLKGLKRAAAAATTGEQQPRQAQQQQEQQQHGEEGEAGGGAKKKTKGSKKRAAAAAAAAAADAAAAAEAAAPPAKKRKQGGKAHKGAAVAAAAPQPNKQQQQKQQKPQQQGGGGGSGPRELAAVGDKALAASRPPLRKALYTEAAEVAALSPAQVQAWREERRIAVEGSDMRPITAFAQSGGWVEHRRRGWVGGGWVGGWVGGWAGGQRCAVAG